MKRIFYFFALLCLAVACQDDDSFSTSSGLRLTFAADTVTLDTVFSRTPSSTYSFWVYNRNDEGIRLSTVRLARGNQSGFRVNVDGTYLDNANGAVATDLEIRRRDSILVFVELTAAETSRREPMLIADDLEFLMESGAGQKVRLQAWAWDALKLYSPVFATDTVIASDLPVVVFGDMTVAEGAVLTLRHTTLYFHDGAGLEVYGTLHASDCLLRGDRLDRMFSYLPYDRVSGQWRGVRLHASSVGNELRRTEIRNPLHGILCDSAAVDPTVSRLSMDSCIVHNCQGPGVQLLGATATLRDCQLSNTLGPCLDISGGHVAVSYCTLAQFYPFSADRGPALQFAADRSLQLSLSCDGSILTGYDDDVLSGTLPESTDAFSYAFSNSLIRTPQIDGDAAVHFTNIHWESPSDSIQGKQHFLLVDEDNLRYDFHLDARSTAQGLGCYR